MLTEPFVITKVSLQLPLTTFATLLSVFITKSSPLSNILLPVYATKKDNGDMCSINYTPH
jgi:hypothetical protein